MVLLLEVEDAPSSSDLQALRMILAEAENQFTVVNHPILAVGQLLRVEASGVVERLCIALAGEKRRDSRNLQCELSHRSRTGIWWQGIHRNRMMEREEDKVAR